MSCQESLDYLYGLQKFGIKLGLENIRTFLSRLGHPESRFKTVLVAGTNGKGSIATALAEILTQSGYRTGLYTSPHLHTFSERIRINGQMIPEETIAELVAEMRDKADGIPLTFFEFTTALALQYFSDNEIDIAILEVGLGGRFDATNAIKPILSVIAPVARDHQQYLGTELDQIAREKAGILRGGVPAVSSMQVEIVAATLREEANKAGTHISVCGREFDYAPGEEAFDYRGIAVSITDLHPGIPGRHQFGNMATALAAAEVLQQNGYDMTPATMRSGVESVFWPGRLEWLANRTVLLDGAHNGAGARALATYLGECDFDNVHWIVGMKADKNMEEILGPLLPLVSGLYCVEPPVEEAVPASEIVEFAERNHCPAASYASCAEAFRVAREAAAENGVVLVAGSLFLVAELRELILQEDCRRCDKSFS